MVWDHVVRGGTVVTPERCGRADIYIREGKIAEITPRLLPGDALETTDASGKYVFPGFVDTHVHSRDGRASDGKKEDFAHSSMAAVCGGVTTLCEMPNCFPPVTDAESLRSLAECAGPKAYADFGIWGVCLGSLNNGALAGLAEAGAVGFKYFWGYAVNAKTYALVYNYRSGMPDVLPPLGDGEVFRIFRTAAPTGLPVAVHAENFDLVRVLTEEVRAQGGSDYAALLRSRPAVSETTVIGTAVRLAAEAGVPLHILHTAAGDDVEVIRRAQQDGLAVTAETCPHYLALTDADAPRLGAVMKTYPLVRTQRDREMLWQGVRDGVISQLASDHAPHPAEEKTRGFWEAPAGIAGVETSSLVLLDAVAKGLLSPCAAARIFAENPARLAGLYPRKGALLPGADADLAVAELGTGYTFRSARMHSLVKLSPYDGMTFRGRVVQTVLRGRTVSRDGEPVGGPSGRFLRRG